MNIFSYGKTRRVWKHLWQLSLLLVCVLVVEGNGLLAMPAYAAPNVTIRLVIERVQAQQCFDKTLGIACGSGADFYAVVKLADDPEIQTAYIGDQDDISPDNWQFSTIVDFATRPSIPISIAIYDRDGGFRSGDDHADINPGAGSDLTLNVQLSPCTVTQDASGLCGATLTTSGNGDDDGNAKMWFRVEMEIPQTPGLNVQCLHTPIWPQANDQVTFTANVFDDTFTPKIADSIELWVNSQSAPSKTGTIATTLSASGGLFANGTTVSYGCLVHAGGGVAWSGWHTVQIGNPAQGRAVPIIYTGSSNSRIDIVFIPDSVTYPGGANNAQFLTDTREIIENAYYHEKEFLLNQDKLNFWVALDSGVAQDNCRSTAPTNWDDDYMFADAGALVHTASFRDCASPNTHLFSSEPTSLYTFLHETGHQPFGLADEYCCDGGYLQNNPFPNIYDNQADCLKDPLATTSDACQEIADATTKTGKFRLDPASTYTDDLMTDQGNHTPQPADTRRIEWLFGQCRSTTPEC